MKTIGIMGGTFNPIHKGHIGIAKAAYEQFQMDEILIMPSKSPAYKDNSIIVSESNRCDMIELAIKKYDFMSLSKIELEREGNTYTADTLTQIHQDYEYIYFIIGADSLLYLDKWKTPEIISKYCHILCANRDEHPSEELIDKKHFLQEKFGFKIDFIKCKNFPYSSTEIRRRISSNLSAVDAVGTDVYNYIINNNLYIN